MAHTRGRSGLRARTFLSLGHGTWNAGVYTVCLSDGVSLSSKGKNPQHEHLDHNRESAWVVEEHTKYEPDALLTVPLEYADKKNVVLINPVIELFCAEVEGEMILAEEVLSEQ